MHFRLFSIQAEKWMLLNLRNYSSKISQLKKTVKELEEGHSLACLSEFSCIARQSSTVQCDMTDNISTDQTAVVITVQLKVNLPPTVLCIMLNGLGI